MAEDFTDTFPYGLNNLPAAPPDDFNPSYPANGFASMGTQQLGEPQIIQAGVRFPLPRRAPVGPYPYPDWQVPEIPIPEWWKTLGPMLHMLRGIASGRAGKRGNDDECYKLHEAEQKKCWDNKDDYAHPDFLDGCLKKATARLDDCIRNGGRPSKLPEWGPEDEEIWINPDRP